MVLSRQGRRQAPYCRIAGADRWSWEWRHPAIGDNAFALTDRARHHQHELPRTDTGPNLPSLDPQLCVEVRGPRWLLTPNWECRASWTRARAPRPLRPRSAAAWPPVPLPSAPSPARWSRRHSLYDAQGKYAEAEPLREPTRASRAISRAAWRCCAM